MRAAAVAIGVDKTGGGLTPLSGAASGAEQFELWAKGQGMDVKTLTDADREVRASDIFQAIQTFVDARIYGKLVVFFAGHGFLLSPQTELWLLSDAPSNPNEAVNVKLSRDNARYCGIPHVIFVADACRSGGNNHTHRSVNGSSIFPVPDNWDVDGEVDTFYGTRPGDPALEFQDDADAVANYKGIFTECLLEALDGKHPGVVKEETDNGDTRWLVPSRPLKRHLREEVPDRAADISIKLQQDPEVRVESVLPRFFGQLDGPPSIPRGALGGPRGGPPREPDIRGVVERSQDEAMSLDERAVLPSDTSSSAARRFTQQVQGLAASHGRESFESRCGFTINEPLMSVTLGNDLQCDVFEESGLHQVRVHDAESQIGTSILIQFANGCGTVLAVKPEYVGTVVVEDGRVVNVNYSPSLSSPLFGEEDFDNVGARVDRRRAFAAAAARNGVFEVTGPDAERAADYLRMSKKLDPTLGIYAAYAYNDTGKIAQIREVLRYMKTDPLPVPFDVALLARESDWPRVAPFCPMLRQGWALLDLHQPSVAKLSELRTMLLPGLWTTLTPEGVDRVRTDLQNGELE